MNIYIHRMCVYAHDPHVLERQELDKQLSPSVKHANLETI